MVAFFQCDPIAAGWNSNLEATCLEPVVFSHEIALTGVLTDLIVLFLPLHMIWKLHLPTGQKIVLSMVFLLGCLYARNMFLLLRKRWLTCAVSALQV